MLCVVCGTPLVELPFYNNNDEKFVPGVPFCPNEKCPRHGLLTITFRKEKNVKGKHKGVRQENVPVPETAPDNSL